MSRVRTIAMSAAFLAFAGLASTWLYVAARTAADFESLLICSQGKDDLVPKALCQTYLFKYAGTADDIAALNRGTGIGWVIRAEDERDRKALVGYLLEKGVDVDALDHRSGITALHASVLENDIPAVELLLASGANPAVADRVQGKSPLDFAIELQAKPNQPDRSKIIQLLSERAASPQ